MAPDLTVQTSLSNLAASLLYNNYYQNQSTTNFVKNQIYSSVLTTENIADGSITGAKLDTEAMVVGSPAKTYNLLALDSLMDVIYTTATGFQMDNNGALLMLANGNSAANPNDDLVFFKGISAYNAVNPTFQFYRCGKTVFRMNYSGDSTQSVFQVQNLFQNALFDLKGHGGANFNCTLNSGVSPSAIMFLAKTSDYNAYLQIDTNGVVDMQTAVPRASADQQCLAVGTKVDNGTAVQSQPIFSVDGTGNIRFGMFGNGTSNVKVKAYITCSQFQVNVAGNHKTGSFNGFSYLNPLNPQQQNYGGFIGITMGANGTGMGVPTSLMIGGSASTFGPSIFDFYYSSGNSEPTRVAYMNQFGAIQDTSDRRIKSNIAPLEGDVFADIMRTEICTFKMYDNPMLQVGVIAQQALTTIPMVTSKGFHADGPKICGAKGCFCDFEDDSQLLSVDYARISVYLTRAFQQFVRTEHEPLRERCAAQEKELKTLRAELGVLRAELGVLRARDYRARPRAVVARNRRWRR